MVYSVAANKFGNLSEMIDGRPMLSEKFQFSGHTADRDHLEERRVAPDDPMPVTVDLATAFETEAE